MFKRSRRHPNADWPFWRILLLGIFVSGSFGALPGVLPPISVSAMRSGWLIGVVAVLASIWSWWNFNWWARVIGPAAWTIQILITGVRAWFIVLGITSVWIAPILAAYLLAWAMPTLFPRLSALIWREQVAPQTRVGRLILGLALALGPSAGVIGAAVGMFGSRQGELDAVLLVMAALASTTAIGLAFIISYQLWPDRPWAQIEEQARKEST